MCIKKQVSLNFCNLCVEDIFVNPFSFDLNISISFMTFVSMWQIKQTTYRSDILSLNGFENSMCTNICIIQFQDLVAFPFPAFLMEIKYE